MAAQNAHENTEEIIDLTELIEKGEVPATDEAAPAPTDDDQSGLHSHMRSLNEEGRQADAEIDDLLAQMEARDDSEDIPAEGEMPPADTDNIAAPQDDEPAFSGTGVAPDGHIVDPNEKLHMPGMGDVDNLLNSLDIPPQPPQRSTATPSPRNTDEAVDQMLDGLTGAACPTAARPETAANGTHADTPDVDELLAAGTVPEPVISDELEALLSASDPAAWHAAPAHAGKAANDAPGAATEERPTAQPAPTPPGSPAAAPQASAASGNDAAPLPDSSPETDTPFDPEALAADLDTLLAAVNPASDIPGTGQPAVAKTGAEELDFDLDALLAAADAEERESAHTVAEKTDTPAGNTAQAAEQPAAQPEQVAPAAPAATKEAPQTTELPVTEPPAQPEATAQPMTQDATSGAPQAPLSDLDIDSLLAEAAGGAAAAAAPLPGVTDATDAEASPARQTEETLPTEQPHMGVSEEGVDSPDIAGNYDHTETIDTIGTAAATANAAEAPAETPYTENTEKPAATESTHVADAADAAAVADPPPAPVADVLAERLDQCEGLLRQAEERASALESAMAEAREAAEQARALADEAREAAGLAQASAEEAQNTARAVGRDSARAVDEVLQAASNAEETAGAAMQQGSAGPDTAEALAEALFEPGHPLHQRFMDAIQAAAAQAAQQAAQSALQETAGQAPASGPSEDPALAERLDNADLMLRGTSARLDSIEERLDGLEPRFNEQVEKSAAAAAARILREEIARLLESEA